jgi:hypothetical protein
MMVVVGLGSVVALARPAHAQLQGGFDGWTADGRAVFEMVGQTFACTPGKIDQGPIDPDHKACRACNGNECKTQKQAKKDPPIKVGKTVTCAKDGPCRITVTIGSIGKIEPDYSTQPDIRPSVDTIEFRADGKALVVGIYEDQPTNHVSENKLWVIDLSGGAGAGATAAPPAGGADGFDCKASVAPAGDPRQLAGAAGRAASVLTVDLDGDGQDDALVWSKGATFSMIAAHKKGGVYESAGCVSEVAPSACGEVSVRAKVDGKRPGIEVMEGCEPSAKSAVWLWTGGKLRKVFDFDSWDAKGIHRTIELVDVDGDGTMEIVVTGQKGKDVYDPRVTKWDEKSATFKNDTALTDSYRKAHPPKK